jgi:hypothetical protein
MNNTSIFTNTIEECLDDLLDEPDLLDDHDHLDEPDILDDHLDESINKKILKNKYEWEPLSDIWAEKLLSNNFFIKNDSYSISIENALSNAGFKTTKNTLCKYISKYINSLSIIDFSQIIKDYRSKYKDSINIGNWDPYSVVNKKDFIKIIKGKEFFFQPDHTTLSLISNSLGINIIVLYSDYSIFKQINLMPKVIMLYSSNEINLHSCEENIDNSYYFPLGLKNKNKIKTSFLYSNLHKYKEILNLLDNSKLLESHLMNAIRVVSSLNELVNYIEDKMKTCLSNNDKKIVFKIITEKIN